MDWPGEKFLDKLADLGAKAFGGAVAPWQIKRLAKAHAEADRAKRLLEAQTERDLKLIESGAAEIIDGAVVPLPAAADSVSENKQVDAPKLVQIANAASDADAARRILNLASIFEKARDEGESIKDESVSDKPVDPDWFVRWRLNAQEVSDGMMQQLWARLLAGEVQSPGSFSLRTLHTLSQMTRDEANFIASMAPFRIHDYIYRPQKKEKFPSYPKLDAFIRLEEMGMLTGGVSGLGLTMKYGDGINNIRLSIFTEGYMLYIKSKDQQKILNVPMYKLTGQFLDLCKISRIPTNAEYLREMGRELTRQGFDVGMAPDTGQSIENAMDVERIVEWL